MLRFKLLAIVAWMNLIGIGIVLIKPLAIADRHYGWSQAAALILIQGAIALAMLYATQQKMARADIADKAFPAVLVAYLLWFCMVWRWLGQ